VTTRDGPFRRGFVVFCEEEPEAERMSQDHAELESVDTFMEWVESRHPGQPEYHQAVRGVAESVIDIARDDDTLREQRVLERLTEPDRVISFRVTWEDDDEKLQINRGYRVQHSNAIGPYKGGLRFEPGVNRSILKFLAFEQVLKNSLTGLNLGAGKGGADFDPHDRSDNEIMRFCHSFMTELRRHIGPLTDVPAGDIGVGSREIGYLFGQYKRLENEFSGALTGKAVGSGGSKLREEATGYGAVYFLNFALDDRGEAIADKRIAVSGAGNVAVHVALKATQLGAKVVTLSNRQGCLVNHDGLAEEDIETVKQRYGNGTSLAGIAADIGADFEENAKPWTTECDIAVPSATQNEIDADDAEDLLDAGASIIVEGANMPLTASARDRFKDKSLHILPGKAANAGGVAVSGFEMSQNSLGRSWTADHLDEELCSVMRSIYDRVAREGERDGRIDYCRGADRAGFRRVAAAVASFGPV
jgi:glutamate dehydrogenase (NADP+)